MPNEKGEMTEQEKMELEKNAPDFVKEAEAEKKTKGKKEPEPQEESDKDEAVDIGMPDVPQTPQEKSLATTKAIMRDKAYDYFLTQAQDIVNVTSRIDNLEGRRLVFNALNRIEIMLQEQNISWKQVNQRKLISALANTALLGLDAEQGEVYAIPYREKTGVNVTLQRGYKGERKIRLLHSINKNVADIDAFLVHDGDEFSVSHEPGTDDFKFKEKDVFNPGKVIGSFGYILYTDGRKKVHTLTLADLEKRHQASKMPNSPAWKNWLNEMYLAKTVMATCKDVVVNFDDDKVMKSAYIDTDYENIEEVDLDDTQKIPLQKQDGRFVIGQGKEA